MKWSQETVRLPKAVRLVNVYTVELEGRKLFDMTIHLDPRRSIYLLQEQKATRISLQHLLRVNNPDFSRFRFKTSRKLKVPT